MIWIRSSLTIEFWTTRTQMKENLNGMKMMISWVSSGIQSNSCQSKMPIEDARRNPSPFQFTNVTHQLIVDDDDDPMPSLMFRTTEPHDEPADLPPSRPATLPVPLPVDPPEAPIHNLSNGERAEIMLDAREQKKYDGMSNAKLKKIRKATTLSEKHDSKKDNVIDCLYKIIT
jgi:hypothetical protein